MRLVISPVEADGGRAASSLYRWLSRDQAVGAYGQLNLQSAGQRPGEMGGVLDVITAVFSDGSAVAAIGSLLVAYRAWRDTRTRPPALEVEKDGVTLVVREGSEQEISKVLSVLFPDSAASGQVSPPEEGPGEN